MGQPDWSATDNTSNATTEGQPLELDGAGFCNEGEFDLNEGSDMGKTVWYELTGTGGPITLYTFGSTFDTVLAVYDADTGAFITCDDDSGDFETDSELVFSSDGGDYLIQVGGFRSSDPDEMGGTMRLHAVRPPGNDNRGSPLTTTDDQDVDVTSLGATVQQGERTTCGNSSFGQTVWFRFVAPDYGTVQFSAKGLDSVVSVYEGGTLLRCSDDSPSSTAGSTSITVEGGRVYLIQVGGFSDGSATLDGEFTYQANFVLDPDRDNDGANRSPYGGDCNDANAAIKPGVADPTNGIDDNCDGIVDPDRDSDGYPRPPLGSDCDDTPGSGARVNPGARDVRGNRVDEDCRGGPAPFKRIRADTDYNYDSFGPFIEITTPLFVRGVPKGATVRLSCRRPGGSGCGKFRERRRRKPIAFEQMRGKRLPTGTVIVIRVTKRNHIGRFIEITVRRGTRKPKKDFDCMNPGTSKPRNKCPALR